MQLWLSLHATATAIPGSPNQLCVSHISHKERARDPDFLCAALSATACAAVIKESRMKPVRRTGLIRKSGGMGHPLI
jgi:hypothetical protein